MSELFTWQDRVEHIHKQIYLCIYKFKRHSFEPPIEIKTVLVSKLVVLLIDCASVN